ncbi:Z1 domain-containing protein [Actinomadura sp. 21ATH]|uniref:Z1 domain-containing protein n=1 Tax=Actinomadura sp. 21ATH TaxID=1735444 RepID=UPI0035BEF600
MLDLLEAALNLAKPMVLKLEKQDRTPERFAEIAEEVATMLSAAGIVDAKEVSRRLEAEFDVWVPQAIVVTNPVDHLPWLEDRKGQIDFAYWKRYRTWLGNKFKSNALEALDETTEQILGLLEDPKRSGTWKSYGMVYGQVQSGKTANYTGVICKAVDAGYRFVVVLTSQHESLRHQTQARLDTEFLGFNSKVSRERDTDASADIGVGKLPMRTSTVCIPVTTQASDFTTAQFQGSPVNIHEVAVLVVAKKNARILRNLRDWLTPFTEAVGDRKLVHDVPMLLIDDEADYASVDTKRPARGGSYSDPEHDPTAINKAIRELLELFEKRAYLAYTATPFANIFISDQTHHLTYGADLFPRSFMMALEPPSNYCGPEVVFGLEDPNAAEIREPLPIIRNVEDHHLWMPDGHRKGHIPPNQLPDSLVEAIDAFVLSTAVRRVRDRQFDEAGGHNTMLIHVTRFTDVQREVARRIAEHLKDMAASWGELGQAGREIQQRLHDLWIDDFMETYKEMAGRSDLDGQVGPRIDWHQVEEQIAEVLGEAASNVKQINGTAEDVLDYESSTPVTVVAVGGDKLSRGLTLEGLTVSYYLRTSRTYDTLLQMGRWFGYRPGYLDATRLYTTTQLVNYYVHITRANRELMDLTASIARAKLTPKDVGLKVLDGGPGNLQVTANAKMRSSRTMSISLAGTRAETLVMRTDGTAMRTNADKLNRLVESIMPFSLVPNERAAGAGRRGLLRENVPVEIVLEFLNGFIVSPRVLTASPVNLIPYIQQQLGEDELVRWTVAITGGSSRERLAYDGVDIPMVRRKTITHARVPDGECEVGVLVSPSHEEIGLPPSAVERAFAMTVSDFRASGRAQSPARASGDSLRKMRDPREGLLMIYPVDPVISKIGVAAANTPVIGYSIAFPDSTNASPVTYRVNQVFMNELIRELDETAETEDD